MEKAKQFWDSYTRKPEHHHIATVKSLYTNKPEMVGEGSSLDHLDLLPYLTTHANMSQSTISGHAQSQYFESQPHIKVYRAVDGDYAEAIAKSANLDDRGYVDRKTLQIPTAHLTSWSTDPESATTLGGNHSKDLPNSTHKRGLLLEKWMPIKNVLHHSGTEVAVGHPEGSFKLSTSNLHEIKPIHEGEYGHFKVSVRPTLPEVTHGFAKAAEDIQDFAKEFKELFDKLKKNVPVAQEYIAERFQVSNSTVNRWMSGVARPHPKIQKAILDLASNLSDISQYHHVITSMLGYNRVLLTNLDAAKFLAGGAEPSIDDIRRGMWESDGNVEIAALLAYNIQPTEDNVNALRSIRDLSEVKKSLSVDSVEQVVEPAVPEASDVAAQITRGFKDNFYLPIHLNGKHSSGSIVVRDPETKDTWLLKPNSPTQSPAAGVAQETASSSKREAAFWHVAESWGLGESIPQTELVNKIK